MNTQKLLTWPLGYSVCSKHLNREDGCPLCWPHWTTPQIPTGNDANTAQPLSLDKTESFSAWLDAKGDSLAAPDSFTEWLRQTDDSI